jgi:dienelactone hydrolase
MPQSPFLLKRHLVDFADLLAKPIVSNSEFSGLFDALVRTCFRNILRLRKGKIGVVGFCIVGHHAFRAAFQPDVRATVCHYDFEQFGTDREAVEAIRLGLVLAAG